MSFIQPRHPKRKRAPFYVLAAVLILLACAKFFLPAYFNGAAHFVGLPFVKVGGTLSENFSGVFDYIRTKKALVARNRELERLISNREDRLLRLDIVSRENAVLKELLGREVSETGELAHIIAAPPRAAYDTLIIDRGTESGIESEDFVIASSNAAIGRVQEAYRRSAKVTLFSTSGVKTDAIVARTDLPIELTGQGGGNFVAEVPRDADVSNNDAVILPHEDNFLVAIVKANELDSTGSFRRLFLKSPINMSELRWVFVNDNRSGAGSAREE